MRHRKYTFKIGRSGAHRKALLANQVCSLILSGEIRTTVTKAKETRRLADRMITLGKQGELHHRRQAISKLRDRDAVRKLFEEIVPQYEKRDGGYTRIVRLGQRLGDGAELCILQFVSEDVKKKAPKKTKAKKEAKAAAPAEAKEADKAEEAPVEEAATEEQAAEEAEPVAAEEEKAEDSAEVEADAPAETAEEEPAKAEEAPTEEAKEEPAAEANAEEAPVEEEKKDS